QFVTAKVDGKLAAQAQLDWSAGSEKAGDAPRLKLALDKATLDGVQLRGSVDTATTTAAAAPARGSATPARSRTAAAPRIAPADGVSLKQLALAGVQVDVPGRSAAVGSVKIVEPNVGVVRERDGKINLLSWLVES